MHANWTPAPPVVADDPVELGTRSTYAAWAQAALARLGTRGPAKEAAWPPIDAVLGLRRVDEVPRLPEHERRHARARAREAGWLLDGAPEQHCSDPESSAPLAGLDVAVKDVIDVAGLPTRNGTPGALWREPAVSAAAWDLVRSSGARCVGKAATHEMAWGVTTPQVPHPLDPRLSTGGSSGGSAAAVAVGACEAALGSDTAGSVRIPAALCGVVGLRPTTGHMPMEGVTPLAPEQDVIGVLAVDVATCAAVAERLLGRALMPPASAVPALRVGVLSSTGRLTPAVRSSYENAVRRLRDAGLTVIEVDTDLVRRAAGLSLLTMLRSSARQHAEAVRAYPQGFSGEVRALLTLGENLPAAVIDTARAAVAAESAELFAVDHLDVVVTPTTACTAPPREAESVEIGGRSEPVSAALTRFTAWASVAGLPALSLPMVTPGSLPSGLQIVAPPGREDLVVGLGTVLEGRSSATASAP